MSISHQRRADIIDALRRGTVPQYGLDALAVGLTRFEAAFDEELTKVARGRGQFKAVRGEYGSGKTFFARWLRERAQRMGFATSEVQISETETPLHRLETVYRRLIERLTTADTPSGAFRNVIDGWFFALEEDVLAQGGVDPNDVPALMQATDELMEQRLGEVVRSAPAFALTLRAYRRALLEGHEDIADGLLAWLAGQPNVAAAIKRCADVKGDIDHFGALSFLQGVLTILRDSGHPGLLLVLDEVETLQRVRGDVRDKSLNALRQLIDEIDSGRFPGLYLLVTGTPAFFDGPRGCSDCRPWPSGCTSISRPTPASTIPGRCRSACRASTSKASARWAARCGTSMPRGVRRAGRVSGSPRWSTTPTSPRWPRRSPGSWAARSASRRGSS